MRREILRLEHLLFQEGIVPVLNYLSMQIFQGEIYGVLCLEQPGIDKMIELICWNKPIQSGQVFFDEKLVNRAGYCDNSRNRVAVIGRQCKLVDELSLADNLFVIRAGYKRFIVPERVIERETKRLFSDFDISLSPSALVKELGNYERIVAEIMRAVIVGEKLIILWEISDLLSHDELLKFHELIRRLARSGHTFLYIYSHHEVLWPASDRMAVFKGGGIAKVIHDAKTAREHVVRAFGRFAYEQMMKLSPGESEDFMKLQPVLTLSRVSTERIKGISFFLRPGENVVLLDQSNTILEELVRILSGAEKAYEGQIEPSGIIGDKRRRIVVIARDPINSTLFPEMSFIDNLCFPMENKISMFWQKAHLQKSIMSECREDLGDALDASELYNLSKKDLHSLVYYRYLLFRPQIVVCHQPLSDSDVHLRLHILGLLSKLRDNGSTVLVLTTELYDTLQIADRLILAESGRITGEYLRSDFDKAKLMRGDIFPD